MKKKITVILNKDHPNIGTKGSIQKVSPGYALNYLIPQNLAELATIKKIKHYNMFQNITRKQNEEYTIKANQLQDILNQIHKIHICRKYGENYNLFGSINEKNIASILEIYTGKLFEKRQIAISSNIKKIGIYSIYIKITNDIQSELKLHILPENI